VETETFIELPDGLSLEAFNKAAKAIARRDDGQGELAELVLELYSIFTSATHRSASAQPEGSRRSGETKCGNP
jgi:hypothetical protein